MIQFPDLDTSRKGFEIHLNAVGEVKWIDTAEKNNIYDTKNGIKTPNTPGCHGKSFFN